MIDELKKISSTKKDLRTFGFLVGGVFVGLGIVIKFLPLLIIGLLLIVGGFARPMWLKGVHRVWMSCALVMGWMVLRVVLFIAFFVVFTPMKFILKLAGEKLVDTEIKKRAKTYWIYRKHVKEYDNMLEKQF